MTEVWKDIPGFAGRYQASDAGRVRNARGHVFAQHPLGNVKYLGVHLRKDGKRFTRTVHSLILETFSGPRPAGLVCRHRNGDEIDNRAINLVWGTGRENALDKVRHGTHNHAKKTHCKRGHLLREPNLRQNALRDGRRECKSCNMAHSYVYRYGGDVDSRADLYYSRMALPAAA